MKIKKPILRYFVWIILSIFLIVTPTLTYIIPEKAKADYVWIHHEEDDSLNSKFWYQINNTQIQGDNYKMIFHEDYGDNPEQMPNYIGLELDLTWDDINQSLLNAVSNILKEKDYNTDNIILNNVGYLPKIIGASFHDPATSESCELNVSETKFAILKRPGYAGCIIPGIPPNAFCRRHLPDKDSEKKTVHLKHIPSWGDPMGTNQCEELKANFNNLVLNVEIQFEIWVPNWKIAYGQVQSAIEDIIDIGESSGNEINSPDFDFQIENNSGGWSLINEEEIDENILNVPGGTNANDPYKPNIRISFGHKKDENGNFIFSEYETSYYNTAGTTCESGINSSVPGEERFCVLETSINLEEEGIKNVPANGINDYIFGEPLTFMLQGNPTDPEINAEYTKRTIILYDDDNNGIPDHVSTSDISHEIGTKYETGTYGNRDICAQYEVHFYNPSTWGNAFNWAVCEVTTALAIFFANILTWMANVILTVAELK